MAKNETKLKMKDDIMFKAFFSRKENKRFLKDFISSILGEDIKVKEVTHDARLEQLAREQKYGVLDLDVELESGEFINIEMQLRDHKNIERRTTFYASKKISEQEGIGLFYENIRKVIVIAILDYNFINLPDYVTKTVRVAKENREYELNNLVEYHYIELKKFREQNPDMSDRLNQWLAFIDGERRDLLEMAKKENKLIEAADNKYNILTGDEEVKRLAEIRLLSAMEEHSALETARQEGTRKGMEQGIKEGKQQGLKEGKQQGLKEGKQQGLKEGKQQGIKEGKQQGIKEGKQQGIKEGLSKSQQEIARRLLNKGMNIEEINEITGLSIKEIQNLINK